MTISKKITPNPCVGICSTALGDKTCKGCKRQTKEVDHWLYFKEDKKKEIDDRLNDSLTEAMKKQFLITDEELLKEHILNVSTIIRIPYHRSLYCQLYEVCRAYGDTTPIFDIGVHMRPTVSVREALREVNDNWYKVEDKT